VRDKGVCVNVLFVLNFVIVINHGRRSSRNIARLTTSLSFVSTCRSKICGWYRINIIKQAEPIKKSYQL